MNARLTLLAALLVSAGTLRADVVFTLTPAVQYGARSNAVVFTGTLSNTNVTDFFFNDIQISFTDVATNYLAAGTNAFFANVPGILSPGETYSDIVFAVAIDSTTPPGDYFGTVTIQGGTNIFAADNLASQPFQVSSSATLFDAWRVEQFGANTNNPAISGDFADPDGDAIVNLLEYALHLNPDVASATGLPVPDTDPTCGCLALTYTKVIAASDLIYTVEAADEPGGPWSITGIAEAIVAADSLTQTIRASDAAHPFATAGKRFMHLRVTRLP
jgi:hypothetical protein